MPLAIDCSRCFPTCLYKTAADAAASGAGLQATVLAYADHYEKTHVHQHPPFPSYHLSSVFLFT